MNSYWFWFCLFANCEYVRFSSDDKKNDERNPIETCVCVKKNCQYWFSLKVEIYDN